MKSGFLFLFLIIPFLTKANLDTSTTNSTILELYQGKTIEELKDTTGSAWAKNYLKWIDSLRTAKNNRRRTPYPSPTTNNPYGEFATPFTAVEYINPTLGALITVGFLLFLIYIFIRVRRELRKEKDK